MAIDFPSSPANGQVFSAAGVSWQWNNTKSKWTAYSLGTVPLPLPVASGGTGSTTVAGSPFLPLVGGTLSGNYALSVASYPTFYINNTAATSANQIVGQKNSNFRWILRLGDDTVESGAGVGSDFTIIRYNDAGTLVDQPFSINRASGNVGIGITPTTKLHVGGQTKVDVDNQTVLVLNRASTTTSKAAILLAGNNVARWEIGSDLNSNNTQSFFIWDDVAAAGRFFIDASGNTGIGTNAPAQKLHVNGNLTVQGTYVYLGGSTGNINTTGGQFLYGDGNWVATHSSSGLLIQDANGINFAIFSSASQGGPRLLLNNSSGGVGLRVQNTGGNYLDLYNDGNAHIEASNSALWLNQATANDIVLCWGGGKVRVQRVNNYFDLFTDGNSHIEGSDGQAMWINYSYAGYLTLCQGGGNVGIGNYASASARLEVFGPTILHDQIASKGSNAGYFFDDRTNGATTFAWYAHDGFVAFWYNGYGDTIKIDASGNITFRNNVWWWQLDTGGTVRALFGLMNNNVCYVGYQAPASTAIYSGTNIDLYPAQNLILRQGDPYWGTKGGGWLSLSDQRIKRNIADYATGLDAICRLRPVTFQANGRAEIRDDGRTVIGLIADEVESVMPELVGSIRRKLDPSDAEESDIKTLDGTSVIYALINAVQELAAEVAALKSAAHA